MVNRNNKSDLIKFFLVTGGIIFGFIALIAYGYLILDERYFEALDAKISDYIQMQWEGGE